MLARRVLLLALLTAACGRTAGRATRSGSPGEAASPPPSPCPPSMALVKTTSSSVCVDAYEAAIEGWPPAEAVDGGVTATMRAVPAKGIRPQTNVSERDARTACEHAGKRLCTAEEWTAACRGPRDFVYPYGNTYVPGACNEGKPSPLATVPGASSARLDDPRLAEAPNGIAPGGAYPKCVTESGIFDMHGNVHEWVSTSPKPGAPEFGEFFGGFFADGKENGPGCTYHTTAHVKDYHDYSTGFRCCKDASADRGG